MKSKVYASRPMKKNERHQAILDRAFALARSGKYERWLQIEWDLRADGFPEARQVLDSEFLRERLDEECARARISCGGA